MSPSLPIPYVPLMPDLPGEQDAPFYFARFTGETFVNSPFDPPHRHTFQELILVEAGLIRHSIDGRPFDLAPHTLALVARGQVHAFDRGVEVVGWMLRFTDDYLPQDPDGRLWPNPMVLFTGLGPAPTLVLRTTDVRGLNAVAALIEAEWSVPECPGRDVALRHLLATLLVQLGRICTAQTGTDPAAGEEQRVYRAFTALLERDFAAYHDVGYYAATLGIDADRLASVLVRLLGKATKRVIDERLMLEAKRALRYTDRPLKDIAAALGYSDQFHFSKTFKRLTGTSPQVFRHQPGK